MNLGRPLRGAGAARIFEILTNPWHLPSVRAAAIETAAGADLALALERIQARQRVVAAVLAPPVPRVRR